VRKGAPLMSGCAQGSGALIPDFANILSVNISVYPWEVLSARSLLLLSPVYLSLVAVKNFSKSLRDS
jgi:hypothetical protein